MRRFLAVVTLILVASVFVAGAASAQYVGPGGEVPPPGGGPGGADGPGGDDGGAGDDLARTGADTGMWVRVGVVLVLTGAGLVLLTVNHGRRVVHEAG
jgi:hypothetical protein